MKGLLGTIEYLQLPFCRLFLRQDLLELREPLLRAADKRESTIVLFVAAPPLPMSKQDRWLERATGSSASQTPEPHTAALAAVHLQQDTRLECASEAQQPGKSPTEKQPRERSNGARRGVGCTHFGLYMMPTAAPGDRPTSPAAPQPL